MKQLISTILVLFFLFSAQRVYSQQKINYQSIDSATYSQFLKKDYKLLQKTAKIALKSDIDFFYLRYRLGISFYEDKNYEKSLKHFREAYKTNSQDKLLQEYLYFSLLFTQRKEEANELAETFDSDLQKKVNYLPVQVIDLASSLESVSVSGGIIYNNNISANENTDLKGDAFYSETTLQGNNYYSGISFTNRANNRLSFFGSFYYYDIKSLGIIQSNFADTEKKEYSNNNFQYNIGGKYIFRNNFTLTSAFGYYSENSTSLTSIFDEENFKSEFQDINFNNSSFTASLSGFVRIGNFGTGLSLYAGNLTAVNQFSAEANVLWYPFGNTHFYTSASFSYLLNNNENQFIETLKIGGTLFKNISYELGGSYGNHQNYITNNCLETYNTVEPVLFTSRASLIFNVGKFNIIPTFKLQQKESSYYKLLGLEELQIVKNKYFDTIFELKIGINLN